LLSCDEKIDELVIDPKGGQCRNLFFLLLLLLTYLAFKGKPEGRSP
jgi:hypothetical protein